MAEDLILSSRTNTILGLLIISSWLLTLSNSLQEAGFNNNTFFTVSSFRYPKSEIRPYDLRYIRVDLPPWFSSMYIAMESDVDLNMKSIEKLPKSLLPVICFRDGSPPLPDISSTALKGLALGRLFNGSFEGAEDIEIAEQCYPMQKNITLKLTNEQVSPGVWYLGLFNGIGPTRTQGKMIVRSSSYSFSANISVEGCTTSTMWGPFCNQTINALSCSQSENQTISMVSCVHSFRGSCRTNGETKAYSLDVAGIAQQLIITASNVKFNTTNGSLNGNPLMCYVRYGAMPSETLHNYDGDLYKGPLVIDLPKVGQWYIIIRENQNSSSGVCYLMNAQVLGCPLGKAGPNCTWQRYMLQTVVRRGSATPFESYFMPISGTVPSASGIDFPLEPISSNSTWTYFLMDIPRGAAGGNIHIRLTSNSKINYETYVRYGGLPNLDNWDYYYANRTSNTAGSMSFKLYDSSEEKVDFYILYAREGTWAIGLRQLNGTNVSNSPTLISVSLERCPKRCSSHGTCRYGFDTSGLTSYSYCSCDRTHGGFDCSIEVVSHRGHLWQSIALIATNAAALLPAYWALRQKDFAEWVLFTCSGISSGLYHACDLGTWCALSYNVLQFMDFWLSFNAVVSTFVYLSSADEALKRTIHTIVAILTALLALTKATRSSNIIIVLAIGSLGLLVGFLVEWSIKYRSYCGSVGFSLNMFERPWTVKEWFHNLIKTLKKRLHWGFVLAGLITFIMAAICFKVETSESYWIWHSIWHVTIYTSSFFFLCSKVATVYSESHRGENYELTRQDSLPRNG